MKNKMRFTLYPIVLLFCFTACTGSPLPSFLPDLTPTPMTSDKVFDIPLPDDDRVFQFENEMLKPVSQNLQSASSFPASGNIGYYDSFPYYNTSVILPDDYETTTLSSAEVTLIRTDHDNNSQRVTTTIPSRYYIHNLYCLDQYWFFVLSSMIKPDKSENYHSPSVLYMRVPIEGGEPQVIHTADIPEPSLSDNIFNLYLHYTSDSIHFISLYQSGLNPASKDYLQLTRQLIQYNYKTGVTNILIDFQGYHPSELLFPWHQSANDTPLCVYGVQDYGMKGDANEKARFFVYDSYTKETFEYVMPEGIYIQIGGFDGRFVSLYCQTYQGEIDSPYSRYYLIYDIETDQYYSCQPIVTKEGYFSQFLWFFEAGSLYIVEAGNELLCYRKYTLNQKSPIVCDSYAIGRKIDGVFAPIFLPNPERVVFEDRSESYDHPKHFVLTLE